MVVVALARPRDLIDAEVVRLKAALELARTWPHSPCTSGRRLAPEDVTSLL
jgi:hypothetical protein